MKLGFTGTRYGMTTAQQAAFIAHLPKLGPLAEFHHGDCIGADARAHDFIRQFVPSCSIWAHPPDESRLRAFCKADVLIAPQPYLTRNRAIVLTTDRLLATPFEFTNQLRSGTWSTVRFARKIGRPVTLILPDGTIEHDADL